MKHSTIGNPLVETAFDANVPVSDPMTVRGTAIKALGLIALTVFSAFYAWNQAVTAAGVPIGMMWGGLAVALVLVLILSRKPALAPVLAPVYAVVKGAVVGWISLLYNAQYEGIPMQAAQITFAIALAVTLVYSTGLIRPSQRFRGVVASLTVGVMLLYLVSIGLSLFGVQIGLVFGNSWLAIGINVAILALAIANLVVDYAYIEENAGRAEKAREWYAAFAVLTTVIWIYLEVLRLLAKLQSRR